MKLLVKGPVMGSVPCELLGVLDGVQVCPFAPLETGTAASVRVPTSGPLPLGVFIRLPGKRSRIKGQPDGRAVRRHRRSRPGHEVILVNDNRRIPASIADSGLHLAQPIHPDRVDGHRREQGVIGRCNFLGTADEERMTAWIGRA
jgi:hypothetical protein